MRNGINRAFSWIKKTLEITQVATVPTRVRDEVRAVVDLFGWERHEEATATFTSATAATQVALSAQADDVMRLVLQCSVEHFDVVATHTLWITLQQGNTETGIIAPVLIPISTINIPLGMNLPFLMRPGDLLRGKCDPVTPGGVTLRIKARFIDLNFGEYIKSL